MSFIDAAAAVYGPTATRRQLITNTGTTEAANEVALVLREYVTILVGATAVRVSLQKTAGLATVVGSTDILIPANGRMDFLVEEESRFVYVEAADAASAYQVWVWPSSIRC